MQLNSPQSGEPSSGLITSKMHLAIEAVGVKHSGGAMVLLDFLDAAISDSRISKITVFCSPRQFRDFSLPESEKIVEIPLDLQERSYFFRIIWHEFLLARFCSNINADAVLLMTGMGRGKKDRPFLTFVQQPIPFSDESKRRLGYRKRLLIATLKLLMGRSCKAATLVILQTPVMQGSVIEAFGIEKNRTVVLFPPPPILPLESSPSRATQVLQDSPPGTRILYVGSSAIHKNVGVLVDSLPKIRSTIPEVKLFPTWPLNHPAASVLGVQCLGYLNRVEVSHAYRNADILALSSLTETVGLSTLEAMSVGTPVLVADRPYAHAICEDAALFFDPLSPEDFAEKAVRLLRDAELRKSLIGRGYALIEKRRAEHSYKKMAEIIVEIHADRQRGVFKT